MNNLSGEERVPRRFARYASMSVLSMLGLAVYYLTDTFFVANRVGTLGLAALNFSIPVYSVLNGLGLLLGVGGATLFTIHKSRGETQQGNRVYTNMMALAAVLSVLGLLLGWLAPAQLASLLGSSGVVHEMSKTYLQVLMTFAPCFFFSNILIAFMRNDNAPHLSTLCMVAGTASNVVLDYLFMYPLDMGIFGAALATGISPLVGMLLSLLLYVLPKKASFHLCRCPLEPKRMGWCCALGVSAFIGEVSSAVVTLVSNLVIVALAGDVGVAAYGIISNVSFAVIAVFIGLTQGGQPLLSDYYARNMRKEERQTLRLCVLSALVLGVACWAAALLFAPQITALFNREQEEALKTIAVSGLHLYCLGFILAGVNMVLAQALAAVEQPRQAMVISLCRGWILIVTMIVLLSRLWGITGVWLAFPATELLTFALAVVLYLRFGRRRGT